MSDENLEPAIEDAPDVSSDVSGDVSGDMETALGATRASLRSASPIVAGIINVLTFHDSATAAHALREVFGVIERAADEASRRRPRNRPLEFVELNPPALRQLAALCRVFKCFDDLALPASTNSAKVIEVNMPKSDNEPDSAPETDTPTVVPHVDAVREKIARSQAPVETVAESVEPDPFCNPDPIIEDSSLINVLANAMREFEPPHVPAWLDPFSNPAPIPSELDGSELPF